MKKMPGMAHIFKKTFFCFLLGKTCQDSQLREFWLFSTSLLLLTDTGTGFSMVGMGALLHRLEFESKQRDTQVIDKMYLSQPIHFTRLYKTFLQDYMDLFSYSAPMQCTYIAANILTIQVTFEEIKYSFFVKLIVDFSPILSLVVVGKAQSQQ